MGKNFSGNRVKNLRNLYIEIKVHVSVKCKMLQWGLIVNIPILLRKIFIKNLEIRWNLMDLLRVTILNSLGRTYILFEPTNIFYIMLIINGRI